MRPELFVFAAVRRELQEPTVAHDIDGPVHARIQRAVVTRVDHKTRGGGDELQPLTALDAEAAADGAHHDRAVGAALGEGKFFWIFFLVFLVGKFENSFVWRRIEGAGKEDAMYNECVPFKHYGSNPTSHPKKRKKQKIAAKKGELK